ncbi:MAG: DUF3810 family protein [Oscillospiraceae bacterium]|nr:DUF3810 family protein [Oscillospiraceae bacterium]
MQHKMNKYWKIILILTGISLLLNLIAFSKDFCDWYTDHIYPFISDTLGRMTGWLPFCLTDYLILGAIAAGILMPVLLILLIFLRKKTKYRRFTAVYFKSALMILVCVLTLYTFNWLIPLRGSLLGRHAVSQQEYSIEEMRTALNRITDELNTAAWEVQRGANNCLIYPDRAEAERSAAKAMQDFSAEYPRLAGYYPPVKPAIFSDVLKWMGIGGYTNPLTMELTRNKYLSQLYEPVLLAHESAHHQGYYKESEANFLSYMALRRSDDPFLRYAALIELYFTVAEPFYNSVQAEAEAKNLRFEDYMAQLDVIQPDGILWDDLSNSYEAAEAAYKEDAHPLESFNETAGQVAETGWNAQAAVLQEYNYEGDYVLVMEYLKSEQQ